MSQPAKYLGIRQQLLADLAKMKPHDGLPGERDLAEKFSVSRMTVRQALRMLAEEGRIYSTRGRGTFVADARIAKDARLTSFSEDMRDRGLRPGTRLLRAEEVEPDAAVARDLELTEGDAVVLLSRLRLADDLPMCLETIYLPSRFFPQLLAAPLDGSLYELLATRYRTHVARADQSISAVQLTVAQAELLGVGRRSPALSVGRRTVDTRGRIIERAVSLYRPDRYAFQLSVRKDGAK